MGQGAASRALLYCDFDASSQEVGHHGFPPSTVLLPSARLASGPWP